MQKPEQKHKNLQLLTSDLTKKGLDFPKGWDKTLFPRITVPEAHSLSSCLGYLASCAHSKTVKGTECVWSSSLVTDPGVSLVSGVLLASTLV